MSDPVLALRPARPGPVPCKVCGGASPLFGVTDFNRSCEEVRGKFLPLAGVAVYYRRCEACGLIFTDAFDEWGPAEFEAHIYNGDYLAVDPDYVETRPTNMAGAVHQAFEAARADIRVLDYGGGNGRMADELRRRGFTSVTTYDPFSADFRQRPDGRFDLVTCIETLEHMPDPVAGAADIAGFLADETLLVIGTLVQPADILQRRMAWWYAGPRNGHVTLFTRPALALLWKPHGLTVASTNDNLHLAFRGRPPAFAAHIFGPRPPS
jgi:2-polyprenyl-6-hydroxyphenyl methylase/3-demethylubiquinone-9 3-methyltransferase